MIAAIRPCCFTVLGLRSARRGVTGKLVLWQKLKHLEPMVFWSAEVAQPVRGLSEQDRKPGHLKPGPFTFQIGGGL